MPEARRDADEIRTHLCGWSAEAVLCAARGVGLGAVVEVVERAGGTVRGWLSRWWCRLDSVVTGHAGDGNAAEPGRAQEEELERAWAGRSRGNCQGRVLGRPGSLRTSRPVRFGAWYGRAPPDLLLMRFLGTSLRLPDPSGTPRGGGRHQADGRDPAPGRRPPERRPGAWCRRRGPRPPRGRDEAHVAPQRKEDKAVRGPREGEPVVLRGTGPDDQEEDLPRRGKPEHRADHPHDGPSPARDR